MVMSAFSKSSINRTFVSHRDTIFVFGMFIVGLLLRVIFLKENLFFGFEQGRDAQVAQSILHFEKFPLIGPKTDISGIFHGAGYYYLISLLYFIGNGSPYFVTVLLAMVNSASVFFIYATMKLITRDKLSQLLAVILYSVSFNAIIYSRWLSNVSPSITLTSAFIYAIFLHRHKNTVFSSLVLGFISGLFLHFEMLHLLYALFVLGVLVLFKLIHFTFRQLLYGIIVLLGVLSPTILFELRHQFIMTNSALLYITNPSQQSVNHVGAYLSGFLYELNQTFAVMNIYQSIWKWFTPFVIVMGICVSFTQKLTTATRQIVIILLLLCFWSLPYIFLTKDHTLIHFYAGTVVALVIFVSYIVSILNPIPKKIFLVCFVLLTMVSSWHNYFSIKNIFDVFYQNTHRELKYSDQLKVIDYIFTYSGESFHYDAFTVPYFSKNAWDYLYEWIGRKKYPDMYRLNASKNELENKKYFFLIIDPESNSGYLDSWLKEYDKTTFLISEMKIGSIRVQIRNNNSFREN